MRRATRSTPKVWDNLLASYGTAPTFHGKAQDRETYLAEGRREWGEYIRPNLSPGCDHVLEWGAGAGRITLHAARDCGVLYAWEPAEGPRALLFEVSNDLVGLGIHPGHQAVQTMTEELMDRLPDQCITDCFCYNVMHHMCYDDLYDMLVYLERVLEPGAKFIFNYVTPGCQTAAYLMQHKEGAFPAYVWTPAQIIYLIQACAPSLEFVQGWQMDGRRFEQWERS